MKTPLPSVMIALTWTSSACNTVKGMGLDIQKSGEKIEDVAKKK